jgi:hypothetical protein
LPYHSAAASKYAALSKKNTLPERIPSKEEVESAEATVKAICFPE